MGYLNINWFDKMRKKKHGYHRLGTNDSNGKHANQTNKKLPNLE